MILENLEDGGKTLEYRKLGRTGLQLPVMGFGAGQFGDMYGDTTQENCNETIAMAIDAGINYFDVAPSYGPEGLAETRLGIALKGHVRSNLIVNTKGGRWDHGVVGCPIYEYSFEPQKIRAELENSLKRLQTDYVDIYQLHDINNCPDLNYIIECTIPELEKLKQEGKLRFIGITGAYLDTLKYILDRTSAVDTVLSFCRYNLIDTTLEGYFSRYIEENGLGLINASVLYMGMLTKNVKTLTHWRDKQIIIGIREAVIKANKLCDLADTSLPEQACLFGMGYKEPASTLIGMGRPSSLERNLKMLKKPRNFELEQELLAIFDGLSIFQDTGQINGKTIVGSYSDCDDN